MDTICTQWIMDKRGRIFIDRNDFVLLMHSLKDKEITIDEIIDKLLGIGESKKEKLKVI